MKRSESSAIQSCLATACLRIGFLVLALSLLSAGIGSAGSKLAAGQETPPIDFQRQIRPLIADHCFQCHGADDKSREAGLRLDIRSAAIEPTAAGTIAIVPAKPESSELWKRIHSSDPDVMMPPPDAKKPLSDAEKKLLQAWIAQGAPYDEHWAFRTPQRTSESAANPRSIDSFVRTRLQQEGIEPAPAAESAILCRRLFLDLIGLPPSPEEIDEFVAADRADRPSAVESLVEQLLRREQFGEKWARQWLDVARYADSNGYEKDLPREQWAWRDWVIDAYNRDLPYDQFVIDQIAGDLLDAGSSLDKQRGRIATGFLRNGMINEEGAIVPEEFRMESMYDRIDCLGKAVLGMSLQCGQCHTHKFDPLLHSEYYGIFAFLNDTYESQSWVYSPDQLQTIDSIRSRNAEIDNNIKQQVPDWQSRMATWESAVLERHERPNWSVIVPTDLHSSGELNHPTVLPDQSILTLGHRSVTGDIYMIAQPNLTGVTGIRLEILTHGDLPYEGPGRSDKGTWALTELIVERQKSGEATWEKLKLVNATADFSELEHKLEPEWEAKSRDKEQKRTCGPVEFMIDGSDDTAWRADRGVGRRNTDSVAVAQFEQPLDIPEGTKLKISLRTNHGGDEKNVMIGRFRASLSTAADPRVDQTPWGAVRAMSTPTGQRSREQTEQIFSAWCQSEPAVQSLQNEREELWKQFPEASTSVLHIAQRKPEYHRPTYRLDRGVWTRPLEAVAPHVPAALHSMPATASSEEGSVPTRLDFARWLVDRRSPLTARVAVNRVWHALFGMGLVETLEDLGTRSAVPEYPQLLDWLAVEFMDHSWSQKHLIRVIVSSEVYQRSSAATPAQLERDPGNRLLTRGPRFRLDAEVVRDLALSAAGLLQQRVGGPSIFPPVPQNVLEFNYVRPNYWIPAEGAERYRRAIYVFRKRSMPDPVLTTLDAPNSDSACARRPRSNSPLAALVTLNEPIFVEAARAMALRVLREAEPNDGARAALAFRLCTGRVPRQAESAELLKLIAAQRQRLADGWLSINEVATGNASQRPTLPPGVTPQDAAVWTIAARVVLNLDEALCKN